MNIKSNKSIWTSVVVGLVIAAGAFADNVTLPNTFSAGTPAVAAQVNANFNAVKTAVDDNHTRITALESKSPRIIQKSASFNVDCSNGANESQLTENWVALLTPDTDGVLEVTYSSWDVNVNYNSNPELYMVWAPTFSGTVGTIVGIANDPVGRGQFLPPLASTFAFNVTAGTPTGVRLTLETIPRCSSARGSSTGNVSGRIVARFTPGITLE